MVLRTELFLVDFELVNELGEGLLVNALQLQIPKSLDPVAAAVALWSTHRFLYLRSTNRRGRLLR